MTLNDIISSALAQLDRTTDSAGLASYRERLTRYANEAQNELAAASGFFRTDELAVNEGIADLSQLPRSCIKVTRVRQQGHSVPFSIGDTSNSILLPYCAPAVITYRCVPAPLVKGTDESELDPCLHGLIVSYLVGRERMGVDVTTQSGGNIYLSMFENAKARLRKHRGGMDSYRFENRY